MIAVNVAMFLFVRRVWKWITTPSYVVPLRISWKLRLLNWSLKLPCFLVDYFGYEIPKIGVKLRRPLSLASLKKTAERRTHLADWGDSSTFDPVFAVAVDRLNEVDHSPVGRILCYDTLLGRLVVRLEIIEEIKKKRKDDDFGPPPIFVMGLPRSGTTFLHRLLALDPKSRYPETHELLQPVVGSSSFSREKRIRYWEKKLAELKSLVPQLDAIHEIGAREAEECLLAMSVEVPMLPVTFRHLIRDCVQEEKIAYSFQGAYSLYKRQLQFLQRDDENERRRWVLKCPAHLGFLDDLLLSFPNAKIVWTHRDPAQSLPSLGSMFRTFADMCEQQSCNLYAIGSEQLFFWSLCIQRATNTLKKHDDAAHVKYADLVGDPLATVKKLYAQLGLSVSKEFETNINEYVVANRAKRAQIPRHLKRFHKYTLDEYGLTPQLVRSQMKDYYRDYIDDDEMS